MINLLPEIIELHRLYLLNRERMRDDEVDCFVDLFRALSKPQRWVKGGLLGRVTADTIDAAKEFDLSEQSPAREYPKGYD